MATKEFYVYLHRKETNGEVFYVGKGTGNRAISSWGRNPYYKNVVEKHGVVVEIVMNGLQEWYAFELEQELIALYGRRDLGYGHLTNMTDGGEGPIRKGVVPEEVRREWRGVGFSILRANKDGTARYSPRDTTYRRIIMDNTIEFCSIRDALKFLDIRIDTNSVDSIRRCCDFKALAYKGHLFRYADCSIDEYNKNILSLQIKIKNQQDNRFYKDNSKRLVCLDLGICFKSSIDAKKYLVSIGYSKVDDATIRKAASGVRRKAYGFNWGMICEEN